MVEVSLSGISSNNYYTELAYLSGNTLVFDRNDLAEAYSVDLSALSVTGGTSNALPLSGDAAMTGNYTAQTIFLDSNEAIKSTNGDAALYLDNKGSASNITLSTDGAVGGESNITMSPTELAIEINGKSVFEGRHEEEFFTDNVARASLIISSQNSRIAGTVITNSVVLGGDSLTATTSDTVYVPNLNIGTVPTGTISKYIALDASGNVIEGDAVSITGDTVLSSLTVTGDTVLDDLSATTISILNSGATTREYFDYSSNLVKTGVTDSSIVAGSGNTINNDLRNVLVAGVNFTATTNDTAYFSNVVGAPYDFTFAVSDESTAITTGTSKITLYAPRGFEVSKVKASLTISGSTTTTVDVNINGTTMLSSPMSLTAGTYVNSTTGISTSSISEDDKITVDIDSAGTDATGLKIYLIGKNS